MHKGVVTLGIEHEQTLVEQHVNRVLPGCLDHELRTRLAENRGCIVDELPGVGLDPQVDAALRIRNRRPLRNSSARISESFRG